MPPSGWNQFVSPSTRIIPLRPRLKCSKIFTQKFGTLKNFISSQNSIHLKRGPSSEERAIGSGIAALVYIGQRDSKPTEILYTMSSKLLTILNETPYDLVSSPKATKQSLRLVKDYLDSVIKTYKSIDPQQDNKTSLDEIVVDGLDANQVWWQAKMVIDNIEGDLMERIQDLKSVVSMNEDISESESENESEEELEAEHEDEVEADEEEEEELETKEATQEDESDIDMDIANGKDDFDLMEEQENEEANENQEDENPSDVYEDAKEDVSMKQEESDHEEEEENKDKDGLNDKFFNIEEFNRQTLAQEEGNLEENNADDDEEEIDYFADIPSEEDEEAVYYDDFFDKPNEKSNKKDVKKSKKNKKDIKNDDSELDESDYENAIESAKLDLFEDDEDDYVEDGDDANNELGENGKKLSNFEKQQLEIQKQIEQLEKEAIAVKKWALQGEVKAKDRPEDALLNEELEFDRNAKPVPVITSEITDSLEEMIRDRIKNRNFDDLAKRTVLDMQRKKYRSDFELSDTKSSKSLAELYEDDYKGVDENMEISEELQKSHDEISQLFADLTYKLDVLSSAHFVPRPSQKSLEVRVDTAAITMEDAQPLTMSSASTLAPQEVYSVGKSDNTNEIRLKDGTTMARDELSREDKTRLRRAAKRKRTKQLANQIRPAKKSKKDSVIETLSHAKNITIINKKGEKHDIKGNVQKINSANNIKNVKL